MQLLFFFLPYRPESTEARSVFTVGRCLFLSSEVGRMEEGTLGTEKCQRMLTQWAERMFFLPNEI